MTRIERPTLHEENGRMQCRLPLYDPTEREVGAIWWRKGVREAKLGRTRVPSRFQVYIAAGDSAPIVEITIETIRQVPRCTGVCVMVERAGEEVLAKHLKQIRLTDWIDVAIANVAREVIPVGKGGQLRALARTPGGHESAKSAIKLARSRAKITPEFLSEVAEVYRENFDRPVVAVQNHFRVEHRTAAKYVQKARAEGLLPATSPGKKRI